MVFSVGRRSLPDLHNRWVEALGESRQGSEEGTVPQVEG